MKTILPSLQKSISSGHYLSKKVSVTVSSRRIGFAAYWKLSSQNAIVAPWSGQSAMKRSCRIWHKKMFQNSGLSFRSKWKFSAEKFLVKLNQKLWMVNYSLVVLLWIWRSSTSIQSTEEQFQILKVPGLTYARTSVKKPQKNPYKFSSRVSMKT